MKKLKKIVVFLVVFTMMVGVCSCGTKSPSNTVKDYLEEVKKGENADFSKLVNKNLDKEQNKSSQDKKQDKSTQASDKTTKKLNDSMKKITYTINSEKIEGDKATVNVKVKAPDIASVVVEYMQKGMTMALTQAFSDNQPSKEESDKLYEKIFLDCMENVKYTERTGDISLKKTDGKWEIENNDAIISLLTNMGNEFLNSQSKENKNDKKEIKTMVLNKPFDVETEYGKYNLTIEGARLTDKRNEVSEKKVSKVVMLDYSYANESFGAKEGQDLYIDQYAFQVLDDEGNVLDTYPIYDENREAQNAPVGGKSKGSIAYGLNTDSKNLNVTFIRGNEKVSKIKVPIK